MAEYLSLLFVGFFLGYGFRELISRSRRATAKRRFYDSGHLKQHPGAAETAGKITIILPPARHHRTPSYMLRRED
jgi:hypothetical protein